nr:MAG TPA: hypothetical protein [Caudoviricetes sp.]
MSPAYKQIRGIIIVKGLLDCEPFIPNIHLNR